MHSLFLLENSSRRCSGNKQYDPLPSALRSNDLQKAKAACQPFLKLARENPNDPVAVDAMNWLVTHVIHISSVDEAMDLLARDHVTSERLLPSIRRLDQFSDTTPSSLGLLRAALQNNPHRDTRAWACLVIPSTSLTSWKLNNSPSGTFSSFM